MLEGQKHGMLYDETTLTVCVIHWYYSCFEGFVS